MPITSAYLDASARYHLEYAPRLTIDPVNGSSNCSAVQTPKRRRVRFPLRVNIPTANFLGIRLHRFYLLLGTPSNIWTRGLYITTAIQAT